MQQASLVFVQVNGEMRDPSLKLEDNPENSRSLNLSKFMECFVHLAVALLPKGTLETRAWVGWGVRSGGGLKLPDWQAWKTGKRREQTHL